MNLFPSVMAYPVTVNGIIYWIAFIILAICLQLGSVFLYIRCYSEIIMSRKKRADMNIKDKESNYKAFVTILIMVFTLILFCFPFQILLLLSLIDNDTVKTLFDNYPFLVLLPYLNYISDPLVYAARMRSIMKTPSCCVSCLGHVGSKKNKQSSMDFSTSQSEAKTQVSGI